MEASNKDRFSTEWYERDVCRECALTNLLRKCMGCEIYIEDFTVLPREEK